MVKSAKASKKGKHKPQARRLAAGLTIGGSTILAFLFAEMLSGKFLTGVSTVAELRENFGVVYPAAYSDYLPFTTPKSVVVEGRVAPYAFGRMEFNALGYRGKDPQSVKKTGGVKRILLLGDSFALGWGVSEEDSIAGQMRKRLSAEGQSFEVINAGYHAGYSPDAYYAYFKKEGLELEPDLVAVAIFTYNDVGDVAGNVWDAVDENGGPTRLYTIRTYTDYKGGLLNPRILPWNYHIPLLGGSRLFVSAGNFVNRVIFDTSIDLKSGSVGKSISEGEAWRRMEASLSALSRLCEAKGVPLVFVAFPWIGTPLKDDRWARSFQELIEGKLKRPYRALHDSLTRAHQLPNDPHTNAEGNRVIAESILDLASSWLD